MGKTHHFKSGSIVEVRSAEEILATLDGKGMFEGVPFMEEMRPYCGRRFQVFMRADKICVERPSFFDVRRMRDAVILDEVRCDGSAHDGCGRLCSIFWKEAWLKPAPPGAAAEPPIDWLAELKRREGATLPPVDETKVYSCQSTALNDATQRLRKWDLRPYVRDLTSGARTPRELAKIMFVVGYNIVADKLGRPWYGRVAGTAKKTPSVSLGLCPGELVKVRRKEDVTVTLDTRGKNRGLGFGDAEMSRHCGASYPVLARIERLILEDSGKMRKIDNTVLLKGTECSGLGLRGCARHDHPMWREAWLERSET
jgi:hypothetical protein